MTDKPTPIKPWAHQQEFDAMIAEFAKANPDYIASEREIDFHKSVFEARAEIPDRKFIAPKFGSQTAFLLDDSDICIYGMRDGEPDSHLAVLSTLQFLHLPNFQSVIFTHTRIELTRPGGLLDMSREAYQSIGGKLKEPMNRWSFGVQNAHPPSQVQMDAFPKYKDADKYSGSQFNFVYFNKLNMFKESQSWGLFGTLRNYNDLSNNITMKGTLRGDAYIDDDSFVRKLLDYYIGADGRVIPDRIGKKRWLVMNPKLYLFEQFNSRKEAKQRIDVLYKDSFEAQRPVPVSLSFIPSEHCRA